jgi:hypothetical protein
MLGVPSCDKFIRKFERCARNVPSKRRRASMLRALEETVKEWKRLRRTKGRRRLEASCKKTLAGAERAMGAYRCGW